MTLFIRPLIILSTILLRLPGLLALLGLLALFMTSSAFANEGNHIKILTGGEGKTVAVQPSLFVITPKLVQIPSDLGETISATIARVAVDEGLSVLTALDAAEILKNAAHLASLGADADGMDLAELGRKVGAKYLLAATVSRVDGDTLVQMRLIESNKSRVLTRRELRASAYDDEIMRTVESITGLTLGPIFAHIKGSVALTVTEEGADIMIDGTLVGVSPLTLFPQAGGSHLLTVVKKGFIRHSEEIKVGKGDVIKRMIKLRPSRQFLTDYRSRNGTYRRVAWASVLTSVPMLGGAAYFFNKQKQFELDNTNLVADFDAMQPGPEQENRRHAVETESTNLFNSAQRNADLGTGALVTGVVAGLVSTYFWVFGQNPNRYIEFEKTPTY